MGLELLEISFFGVVLLKIAGLAEASGVGHEAGVFALGCQLLPSVDMVAMVAHSFGIMLGFSVWASCYFAVSLCSLSLLNLWYKLRRNWDWLGFIFFSVPGLGLVSACSGRCLLMAL